MTTRLTIDHQRIVEFCRGHHIVKLAFFGSVLREDFRPDSDVDVLAWFDPGHVPGMFKLVAMENELSGIVGRVVDLRTPEDLSRLFRQEAIQSAEVEYAA